MPSYNKVLLMGNLTRDPQLKQTPSNMSVAEIGLACNRKFKAKDGEMREETTFVDCEAWGRTAETMAKYLSQVCPVFVEGRLKLDQWQDKDDLRANKNQDGNSNTKPRYVRSTKTCHLTCIQKSSSGEKYQD